MRSKTLIICLALTLASAIVLALELSGVPTGLSVRTHGDVTRELQFFAQYGQFTCVACIVVAIWLLDRPKRPMVPFLIAAVLAASCAASVVKVATGRARPNREHAGQFQGPFVSGSAYRSFPSGHTTSAFALSAALVALYPRGRGLFWTLAAICGALRWTQDAHWLSDVLAGAALGIGAVALIISLVMRRGSLSIEPWLPG